MQKLLPIVQIWTTLGPEIYGNEWIKLIKVSRLSLGLESICMVLIGCWLGRLMVIYTLVNWSPLGHTMRCKTIWSQSLIPTNQIRGGSVSFRRKRGSSYWWHFSWICRLHPPTKIICSSLLQELTLKCSREAKKSCKLLRFWGNDAFWKFTLIFDVQYQLGENRLFSVAKHFQQYHKQK